MNERIAQRPIHEWAAEDRPREKMIDKGIQSLTDAELVATLLSTGTRDQSAIALARTMIDHFGGLPRLSRAEANDLMQLNGIGKAKATTIMAAFELARRRLAHENSPFKFSCSKELSDYLMPKIGDLAHEVFYVLFADSRNHIIGEKELYRGGLTKVSVDANHLFKQAMSQSAFSIVIAHNHPSGRELPSESDDELTQHIVAVSRLVGIPVLDHLIVTHRTWYSYADHGLIEVMKTKADKILRDLTKIGKLV